MELRMTDKILIVLLFLIFSAGLLAANTLDSSYDRMISAYDSLNTWQAFIFQTNYFAQSKAELNSTGNFYYQKGNIAIRYDKPSEQVLLVKDGKITFFDKSSNTGVKMDLNSSVQSLNPVQIIKNYWQKSEKSVSDSSENSISISLKPKSDKQINQINFTLDYSTGYVNQLTYVDKQGNSVSVAFSKIKVNKQIPANVWKLDLPPGTSIIER
jgi:outer membrane lipoprotein-sorting protein